MSSAMAGRFEAHNERLLRRIQSDAANVVPAALAHPVRAQNSAPNIHEVADVGRSERHISRLARSATAGIRRSWDVSGGSSREPRSEERRPIARSEELSRLRSLQELRSRAMRDSL